MKSYILRIFAATALIAVTACSTSPDAMVGSSVASAAKQGDAEAQYALCIKYKQATLKRLDKAVPWCRKAADQGHADAQVSMGHANLSGWWFDNPRKWCTWCATWRSPNQHEAVNWYRKAANQGHAEAQNLVGNAYWSGVGVVANEREAIRWWRASAAQSNIQAQYSLGYLYWHGQVVRDTREAYIWWSIAKANGDAGSAHYLRTNNWPDYEIARAQAEATQRLEAIRQGTWSGAEKFAGSNNTAIGDDIAIAAEPKGANIAARVFGTAASSVVVVRNGSGQGSGVIIRPNVVATNCHVVDAYGAISVYKSDRSLADADIAFSAKIRHSDARKDFCLLDVRGLQGKPATVRKFDTLKVGEDVYGLGAPQGYELSLSDGVISQLRASGDGRWIQTNAEFSPGSSGGGLFDSDGNLIGILTSKLVGEGVEGIGFAIPADLVLRY